MTIGSIELGRAPELSEVLGSGPADALPPTLESADASFASTLAEAASAVSTADGLTGSADETLFSAALDGAGGLDATDGLSAGGGSSGELDLLALLLAAAQGGEGGEGGAVTSGVGLGANGLDATGLDTAESGDPTASAIVTEAVGLQGTPYVWGGTSPQGFDCSGFTQYVYGQLGVNLPRTSEEQATAGTPVQSLAEAQPGDLVFFAGSDGTADAPGHVGIYLGNGEMIDAPHTGTTVQVQPVSSAGAVVAIRHVLPGDSSTGDSLTGDAVMGNVKVPAAYVSTITQAAADNGIPSSLLAALLSHESGFDPTAVSAAGAQGVAQFMPATAAGLGIDPDDPTQAIEAAARLLGSYTARFGSYGDALAAYNAGPAAVARYGGIPPYAQTEAYVPAVLSLAGLSGTPTTPGTVA